MKLDVLLVPVDFSDVTQAVYEAAADLAGRLGSKVVLLKVTEPEIDYVGMAPPQALMSADETMTRAAESALAAGAEYFVKRSLQVETLHLVGPVLTTILDETNRSGAGMIVLGSHGHGAIYSLFVGSIAEGVIRHASVPVLVVPDLRAPQKTAP